MTGRHARTPAWLPALVALAGCGGPAPFELDARLADVEPRSAVAGRVTEIVVTARYADFDPSKEVVVDLGDGIATTAVALGSDLVRVHAAVDSVAALGLRTVVVTQDERRLTLDRYFEVVPPFDVEYGRLRQGEIAYVHLFGRGTVWSPYGPTFDFGPGTSVLQASILGDDEAVAIVQVDLFAAPGPRDVTVTTVQATESVREAYTIEPVAIESIALGDTVAGEIGGWLAFRVYRLFSGVPRARLDASASFDDFVVQVFRETDGRTPLLAFEEGSVLLDPATDPRYLLVVRNLSQFPTPADAFELRAAFEGST